ncbi:alkaline phosphatase family protein [Streptomyces sp. NPDC087658]|uniref:alkaline phosphatase family protein n=1 Tax=Streptomyces sp. NPDC087658 TaxID=3365800 RepID=UPI003824163C
MPSTARADASTWTSRSRTTRRRSRATPSGAGESEPPVRFLFDEKSPDLTLVHTPQMDYGPQRSGPRSAASVRADRRPDDALSPLTDHFPAAGAAVVALGEYGITPASRPVDLNRALRRAGLPEVPTRDGMACLAPRTSGAFVVADHQVAHVCVRDLADVPEVAKGLGELDGVEKVLGAGGKAAQGPVRSGELAVVADADAWFTYYYWLDDDRAPDFARQVEIHRKPGCDPAEPLWDDTVPAVKPRAIGRVARKEPGFRYRVRTVPLDPADVRGSHGRAPTDLDHGPVLLCSEPAVEHTELTATDVKPRLWPAGSAGSAEAKGTTGATGATVDRTAAEGRA